MTNRPAVAGRWTARPGLAMLVRALVLAVPVAIALFVALVTALLLPVGGTGGAQVLWWLAVLGSSSVALLLTDRLARRALPLAVLLELTLVFPDKAPSRMKAARTGSVAQLERTLDRLRRQGGEGPEIDAAETLVVLVGILGLHDKKTRGHSERVRAFTDLLTLELGLDEDDRAKVRWASLVHDLGKLRVPVSVLNGGKNLADEEWAAIRRHPEEGQRLAAGFTTWLGEWGRTIVEHHERWDGGGYPKGLAGEQISYGARIVAVADSFEVMTAARSYAPARSAAAARAELARCAGSQFDPDIVRAFLGISVRRLSWVLGPLTWAVQAPVVATVDKAGQAVKVATVSAVAVGVLASSWVTTPRLLPWDDSFGGNRNAEASAPTGGFDGGPATEGGSDRSDGPSGGGPEADGPGTGGDDADDDSAAGGQTPGAGDAGPAGGPAGTDPAAAGPTPRDPAARERAAGSSRTTPPVLAGPNRSAAEPAPPAPAPPAPAPPAPEPPAPEPPAPAPPAPEPPAPASEDPASAPPESVPPEESASPREGPGRLFLVAQGDDEVRFSRTAPRTDGPPSGYTLDGSDERLDADDEDERLDVAWRAQERLVLDGRPELALWIDRRDKTSGPLRAVVGLYTCDEDDVDDDDLDDIDSDDCQLLTNGRLNDGRPDPGGFVRHDVKLGRVDVTVPAGDVLLLSIVGDERSGPLLIGFGTVDAPSRLELPVRR